MNSDVDDVGGGDGGARDEELVADAFTSGFDGAVAVSAVTDGPGDVTLSLAGAADGAAPCFGRGSDAACDELRAGSAACDGSVRVVTGAARSCAALDDGSGRDAWTDSEVAAGVDGNGRGATLVWALAVEERDGSVRSRTVPRDRKSVV